VNVLLRNKCWKILLVAVVGLIIAGSMFGNYLIGRLDYRSFFEKIDFSPRCEVPQMISSQDQNQNGIPDAIDMVKGARQEVERGTVYDGSYFQGGYPPEGKGACTDVIWRAFKVAGYDLKKMVDEDIRTSPEAYGATGRHPDPNIDFRRVSNLQIFFKRHGQELTTQVIPGDATNLSNWQPGDIVVFGLPLEHIGIISDQRGRDGVPQMIHNCGPLASEGNYLLSWNSKTTYHFRFIRLEASKSSY
jgi:uncharacterized protein YijF (DUF1287 family)